MQHTAYSWLDELIGRDADLKALADAYDAMLRAGKPAPVILIADGGVGKTRLVREFYLQLVSARDPAAYWPAAFDGDLVTLDLNPDFSRHTPPPHDSAMPFLWWGVRFRKPDLHNRPEGNRSAFLDSAAHLLSHFALVERRAARHDDKVKAFDLAVDTIIEFGFSAIPYAGFFKTIAIKAVEAAAIRKELKHLEAIGHDPHTMAEQREANVFTTLLNGISALLSSAGEGEHRLPFVLVLDDLHWIDAASARHLAALLGRAAAERWPVLLLATTWPSDWKGAAVPSAAPHSMVRSAFNHLGASALPLNEMALQKMRNTSSLVERALPGLTREQRDLIANKFGGDLYAIVACSHHLRERMYMFVNEDTSGCLTEEAVNSLGHLESTRESVVQARFNALSEPARTAISIAALLARQTPMSFVEQIADEWRAASAESGPCLTSVKHRLSEQECRWMVREPQPGVCEFVDEVTYEVAAKNLISATAKLSAVTRVALQVAERWISAGVAEQLPSFQLGQFVSAAQRIIALAQQDVQLAGSPALGDVAAKIAVIGAIVNGLDADHQSPTGGFDLVSFEAQRKSLHRLPFAWSARWIEQVSNAGTLLWSGGADLAIRLREEALGLMEHTAQRVRSGDRSPSVVGALALFARTGVGLSWRLVNDVNLTVKREMLDSDVACARWLAGHDEELLRLEAETLVRIATTLNTLGQVDSAAVAAARSCILLEQQHMTVKHTEQQTDINNQIAGCLEQVPLAGSDGETWAALLFRHGPLQTAMVGWKTSQYGDAARARVRHRVIAELGAENPEALGTFQLLALALSLCNWSAQPSQEEFASQIGKAAVCYLELVRRGMGALVVDWSEEFGGEIELAMGMHQKAPDDLELGWTSLTASLQKLKAVSDRATYADLTGLVGKLLKVMARHTLRENGAGYFAQYLARAAQAGEGRFLDLDFIARRAWMNVCLVNVGWRDKPQRIDFLVGAMQAVAGIPPRFFTQPSDFYRVDKVFEELMEAGVRSGREIEIYARVSGLVIEQLEREADALGVDAKAAAMKIIIQVGVYHLKGAPNDAAAALREHWLALATTLVSNPDDWQAHLPAIRELTSSLLTRAGQRFEGFR